MSSELQLDVCCLSCCGGDIWWTHTKERRAWCCLQVKLCDPCLSALCVPWCKKALYKCSSFPFLSSIFSKSAPLLLRCWNVPVACRAAVGAEEPSWLRRSSGRNKRSPQAAAVRRRHFEGDDGTWGVCKQSRRRCCVNKRSGCCPVNERLAKQTKRLVLCAVQLLSN